MRFAVDLIASSNVHLVFGRIEVDPKWLAPVTPHWPWRFAVTPEGSASGTLPLRREGWAP